MLPFMVSVSLPGRVGRPVRRTAPNRGRLDGRYGMTAPRAGLALIGQSLQSCTIRQRGARLRTLDEPTGRAPRQPGA